MILFLNEINYKIYISTNSNSNYMILIQKDEKITTNFEPVKNEDVINKVYLEEKLLKINGQISYLEKDCKEFELQYNKESVEKILVQGAVKRTVQTIYDKDLSDNF